MVVVVAAEHLKWLGVSRWTPLTNCHGLHSGGGSGRIENKVAKGKKRFECFCSGQLLESQVVNSSNISIMESLREPFKNVLADFAR